MKLLLTKELYFSQVAAAHTTDGNFSSNSKISARVQNFSEPGAAINEDHSIEQAKNSLTAHLFKCKNVFAKTLSLVFILAALNSSANTYYVATNGNDANPGTINSPFKNWEKLEEVLAPGDIAYIRGGTYTSPRPFNDEYKVWWQYINGTAQNPIIIQNYPGEFPVLDYSGQLFSTPGVYGLYLQYSSHVRVKGLRVTGLAQNPNGNAVNVFTLDNCNNVTVEGCEFDNSGGTGVVLLHSINNLILNCDSHHLGDGFSPGYNWGGTNGFAITWAGNTSTNNTFRGCRAWEVSDNGFAFFGSSGVATMENCWAFRIGWQPGTKLTGGDGVGYKLGPGNGQTTSVIRILRNCLAFENRFIGFDENFNGDNMYVAQIDNCAAYKNGIGNVTSNGYPYISGYNYDFHQTSRTNIFRNNIGYVSASNVEINPQSTQITNSWQSGVTVSDADFLSLSSAGMEGPRQADGSLPDLNFLKLAASSDLINAGTNIGLPFNGSAPDRSAFEFGSSQVANQAPTANAGANQNITLPTNSVTLTGTGTDPDGSITAYQWTKITGPACTIVAPAQASTLINSMVQGVYQFELRVTDNAGAFGRDTVTVTVNAAPANQAPTANAGANQNITLPTNSVTLTGTGTDPDGSISAYQWTKLTGPACTIVAPAQASTVINSMVQGVYQFELRVTDNAGAFGRDTVTVTVNAAPANQAPIADAGANQNITLPTNSVTLSGTGTDPDGSIAAYQWTKLTGPACTIVAPAQASTVINAMVQGVYQFELRVTDNAGAFGRDTVIVTVNAVPANQAPTANAGLNQNITLPTNSVTLTGTGTDPDGSIAAYQWTKIAGPACTIVAPAQASTIINAMVQGVYQFELRVTDNVGAFGRDTVIVTVNAAANQAPAANAGLNQNITLPTNSVTLTGTGNDPDGSISAYQWTKLTGPACTIVSPAQASTVINSMVQGVYQFELRVTDNAGAFGRDTVIVTVNAAANQAPNANAGANQTITLPTNSVTLTGTGNDPDGSIVSYRWTKISGPAQFNILSFSNPQTTLNNLVAGTYQFQLEVTDNAGVTASDVTVITVNQATTINNRKPTSQAGRNKKVSSSARSMVLEGSGTDPDGNITDYSWRVITSPSQCRILNPSSPTTEVVDLTEGKYEFELKVTDNHGEAAMDTVEIEVEKTLVAGASIFPNPVTDVVNLTIESSSVSGPASVVIYDMSGKLFYQEAFTTTQSSMLKKINVSGFRNGTYIVKIISDNKSISLKMVKQ